MDSGNEVVIVDELTQTNGFNGNYEEVVTSSEMKTRSKGGSESAAKLRSSSRTQTAAAATATAILSQLKNAPDDKTSSGSGTDKDKKMNLRSGESADGKAQPSGGNASGAAPATAAGAAAASKKNVIGVATVSAALEGTPSKRKGDREDDSGINSRSSSVSNDETYTSRRRTRSKTAEALSSSTPASTKKGAARMPLSAYDFDDDASLDDDATTSTSLKRKATTLFVEEMEEVEDKEDEPPVKVTVIQRSSFLNVLLNPLKAIRGKMSVGSQTEKSSEAKDDVASQTHPAKVIDEEPRTEHVASQTENNAATASTAQSEDEKQTANTCAVM